MLVPLVYSICAIALLIALFFSSKEDIKYHRISKKYVIICFIIAIIYNNVIGGRVEATVTFGLTLGLFSAFTFLSRGGFGFGDSMILGSIGWFIGNLRYLQYYFVVLGFCMLILGSYFIIKDHKKNGKGFRNLFIKTMLVPVNELKPGMILAHDYFMKGLTEKEIDELKKVNDSTILIKQAYPFIPVIFTSFLIYVIVYTAIL